MVRVTKYCPTSKGPWGRMLSCVGSPEESVLPAFTCTQSNGQSACSIMSSCAVASPIMLAEVLHKQCAGQLQQVGQLTAVITSADMAWHRRVAGSTWPERHLQTCVSESFYLLPCSCS